MDSNLLTDSFEPFQLQLGDPVYITDDLKLQQNLFGYTKMTKQNANFTFSNTCYELNPRLLIALTLVILELALSKI